MIIVEGCDNTGKTTLIEQLVDEFPELVYVKSHGPGEGLVQWVWRELFLNMKTRSRVYDRFFFSEFVYGPLLRGKLVYSRFAEETILATLRFIRPLVILCERFTGDVIDTFGERKQMEGVEEKLVEIQKGYTTIVQPMLIENEIDHMLYDFKIPWAFKEVVKSIELHLGRK